MIYIGILPESELKKSYKVKFLYEKMVHDKNVKYYDCCLIESIDSQTNNKINKKLINLLDESIQDQNLFENPFD